MRSMIVLTCAIGCSVGCGGGGSNCAPAGLYTTNYTRSGGDCPTTKQVPSQTLNVAANEDCGAATLAVAATDADGCSDALAFSLMANGQGFSPGTLIVKVDCTAVGGASCTANFAVSITKQ